LGLGQILLLEQKPEQALAQYAEAVRLAPSDVETRRQLGLLLQQQGKPEQALREFSAILELQPGQPGPHYELAVALARIGQTGEAAKHFRQALQLKPDWVQALNNLAWILATDENAEIRDGIEAVTLSKRACELSEYQEPGVLGTLAAAYAESGQFKDAIQTAERARELAVTAGKRDLAARAETRLKLYQAGKPYREKLKQ